MPSESTPGNTRRDWEVIQENGPSDKLERLRIKGGWLYRSYTTGGVAMVFVPGGNDESE
jgi:hypothetical protein